MAVKKRHCNGGKNGLLVGYLLETVPPPALIAKWQMAEARELASELLLS